LPVQWLLPVLGWRSLFWGLALLVLLSMGWICVQVPRWTASVPVAISGAENGLAAGAATGGYAEVWRHPYFRRLIPMGFFSYGGMVAMQTLWAGPWMVKVCGYSALEAATGLFWVNVAMLVTFWSWGMLSPWLAQKGWHANTLMTWGLPSSLLMLALVIGAGPDAGIAAAALWALFCMGSSFASLSQPALALAFPPALAGRALSAFNLVIFAGVFAVQWGIGLAIDAFKGAGWSEVAAYQAAMGVFWIACLAAYLWFVVVGRFTPEQAVGVPDKTP
jgi:hypothetical protein